MCLPIKVRHPEYVLEEGVHEGLEYAITFNDMGFRCGYVRIPAGHPWHGKNELDIPASVHGGLTFAEADLECGKGGPEDAWWIGFDCGHGGDAPDPSLPCQGFEIEFNGVRTNYFDMFPRGTIRNQDYVRDQCKQLCEQANKASDGDGVLLQAAP